MSRKSSDQRCVLANGEKSYVCISEPVALNEEFHIHSVIKALIDSKGCEIRGGVAFLRYLPCRICAAALVVAGIHKVVYKYEEKKTEELVAVEQLLIEAGIEIVHNEGLDI